MTLQELKDLVPPPKKPRDVPRKPNWKKIEKMIGLALPADYKEFICVYGTGTLSGFLIICNPFSRHDGFSLLPFVSLIADTLSQLKESEGASQVPFPIHPDRPGLLPFGGDENGNTLYWLTIGKPDAWPCVVGETRGKRWEKFEYPMTTFLSKALKKSIRCKIWPRSFPGPKRQIMFEPYP